MLTPENLYDSVQECVAAIRKKTAHKPSVAIILGTGLGGLAREIEVVAEFPYSDLPNFPVSTVESHHGRLLLGQLSGRPVVAMQGRFHYYEGYAPIEITYPVRVMKMLGAGTLICSNACGAVNPLYRQGDLMILADHLNFQGANPLIGKNDERFGPRFPDMSEPYSNDLIAKAEELALKLSIPVRQGVYLALQGPNLETRAEYRMIRTLGADVVGMSTVPEILVARHMGMRTFAVSVITDMCLPDALAQANITEIIATANKAEPKLTKLLAELVRGIDG